MKKLIAFYKTYRIEFLYEQMVFWVIVGTLLSLHDNIFKTLLWIPIFLQAKIFFYQYLNSRNKAKETNS